MLLDGLPDSAHLKNHHGEMPWGMQEELLAQIVEEISVLVAQKARDEPRHVPRPPAIEAAQQAAIAEQAKAAAASNQPTVNPDGSVKAVGHRQLLEYMRGRG